MNAGAEGKSFIRVGRLRAVYFVPREHPAPAALKDRLDEALSKSVAGALASSASRLFGDSDQSVWLVRRLDVSVDVNAEWGREHIAAAWATEITRMLARDLREDADAHNCIRFPTRAAYLSSFLRDLAESRAWGKWYYRGFEGLRALPQSAALRTAVCADARAGLAALRSLDRHERAGLVRVLSRRDAQRLLDALADEGATGDEGASLASLWRTWGEAELGASACEGEEQAALRLFLCACAVEGSEASGALRDVALSLVRLSRIALDEGERARSLPDELSGGDVSKLYAARGAADAEALAPLRRCPAAHVREVFDALLARGVTAPRAEPTEGPRFTPFGGLLMLLPALNALGLEEATEGWPVCEEASAASVLRVLLLAHCCGGGRALRFFSDPVWRDLLETDPALTPRAVAEWAKGVRQARVENFSDVIEGRLGAGGLVRGRRLALVNARVRGGAACVLFDVERGVWLRARWFDGRRPGACVAALRGSLSRVAGASAQDGSPVVLCDEVFAGALGALGCDVRVVPFGGKDAEQLALEDPAVAESSARRKRLGADLAHLTLPPVFGLHGRLRLALAVAAQGLMRAFSARMPGFALSGLEYLYANFLGCGATVAEEEARRVAVLGRPPLGVVLGMTGAARGAYRLGWLDERPLNLFQEG
jgi:hypothetical protein